MFENLLFTARTLDTRDHRGMIHLIRENHKIRQDFTHHAQSRLIRDITGCQDERRIFLMQSGELTLQLHMIASRARDVARSTGTCTCGIHG